VNIERPLLDVARLLLSEEDDSRGPKLVARHWR